MLTQRGGVLKDGGALILLGVSGSSPGDAEVMLIRWQVWGGGLMEAEWRCERLKMRGRMGRSQQR